MYVFIDMLVGGVLKNIILSVSGQEESNRSVKGKINDSSIAPTLLIYPAAVCERVPYIVHACQRIKPLSSISGISLFFLAITPQEIPGKY